MADIYLTGDPHLGHKNIIKYSHRPFDDITEHDNCIIDNWNNIVRPKDTVIINGDFSFASVEETKEYLKRLQGNKIMVLGDHDKQVWQCRNLFKEITQQKRLSINGKFIFIQHHCCRVWPRSHYNSYHAFAHSHGGLPPIGKSWDVGVDNNHYMPLDVEWFLRIMESRPDNFNLVKKLS